MTSLTEDNFTIMTRKPNYFWKLTVCKETENVKEYRFHISLINVLYRNEKTRYFQVLLTEPQVYHRARYSFITNQNIADMISLLTTPCETDNSKTNWQMMLEEYCKFNDIEVPKDISMPDYSMLKKGDKDDII